MSNHRPIGFAVLLALLVLLEATCHHQCDAQTDNAPANPDSGKTPASGQKKAPGSGQDSKGGAQNQATQPAGPIVAGPGSTVVAPASNAGNSGLIVAAPGSTVVVQQAQPATKAAKADTGGKTNSFSSSKGDAATINSLGSYAKDTSAVNFLGRAGAIDALGILGAGSDDATANEIAKHLGDVLKNEFISPPPVAEGVPAPPPLKYRNFNSELLCFHVVQAAGSIGWGARSILPQMQLLRGNNPILDTAIDRAVTAMQNSPAPQSKDASAGGNPMTANPSQGGQ
jgi:hypothetical protein